MPLLLSKIPEGPMNYTPAELREYRGKFLENVGRAKNRGIEWQLSFEQWMTLWADRIEERGRYKGEYVLCRKNDIGPYAIGNCYVALGTHNSSVRGYMETRTNCIAYGNHLDQLDTWLNRWIPGKNTVPTKTEAKLMELLSYLPYTKKQIENLTPYQLQRVRKQVKQMLDFRYLGRNGRDLVHCGEGRPRRLSGREKLKARIEKRMMAPDA